MQFIHQLSTNKSVLLVAIMLYSCNKSEDKEAINYTEGSSTNTVTLSKSQFESSKMKLGKIEEVDFPTYIQTNGTIDVPPESKATVSTFYAGYVKSINLLPGDKVKKGQVVLTLENPEYIQMQQNFLETKSELAYLKADYERQKTLNDEHIASNKNFMKSEADFKVTLSKYESLKKKLRMININPAKVSETNLTSVITLYAPVSGYITKVEVKKGMLLTPSIEAIGIINTDHLHLELNVFEKDINKVRQGQNVRFRLPDNEKGFYDAEVYLAGKKVDEESRTVRVHGHLKDETSNGFLPGMYIEAQIEIESQKAYVLPEQAVVNIGSKFFVLILTDKNDTQFTFKRKEVYIGKTLNGNIEIINFNNLENTSQLLTSQVLTKGAFNLITE